LPAGLNAAAQITAQANACETAGSDRSIEAATGRLKTIKPIARSSDREQGRRNAAKSSGALAIGSAKSTGNRDIAQVGGEMARSISNAGLQAETMQCKTTSPLREAMVRLRPIDGAAYRRLAAQLTLQAAAAISTAAAQ
jgi:hypothetical protein